MKTLAPLLLLLLLGGCASRPAGPTAPAAPATAAPATPTTHASVSGDPVGANTDFMGGEIHCRIQSIDGVAVDESVTVTPGRHTVIVVLTTRGEEYVSVVQVGLPEPRAYRIHAHHREDAVTVTLVDDNDKLIATSTAALAPQMKFAVFVKQK